MSASPLRADGEQPTLVSRTTDGETGDAEVTFFEAERPPDDRTTRWITLREQDCVSLVAWA
jgi:hypothetical protein